MQQLFINNHSSDKITLFFSGWGMDETPFKEILPDNEDYMICFDYRDLSFNESLLKSYKTIKVVAWSMGVWIASKVLATSTDSIAESIAFNGTTFPIDDEKGIPKNIYNGTLQSLSTITLDKFVRRMCGGKNEHYNHFKAHQPKRDIKSLKEELEAIQSFYTTFGTPNFYWNKAFVGLQDLIFPYQNQLNAWRNTQKITINASHYDVGILKSLVTNG